ncbi:7060_t:CDS:10 [Paraglomus brasilianum]|uniref:7060_t:CDS:1 n=1 Tax=Paraglomus brasilianum TaxID=144538 RepID=A0A9N8YS17_9GLOM|nr:7060_t:CDS:10 [Paraglomus brasilianum]
MFSSGFGGFGGASQGGGFGFGGFGNQTSAQQTFGFGAATTAASSSGFGFGASGSGGMFGQSSGFGGLGSSSTASKMLPQLPVQGSSQPPYTTTSERDSQYGAINLFHTISAMPAYKNFSFEELRLRDYELGRKPATNSSTAFGAAQPSGFGLPASTPAAPSFGTPAPTPSVTPAPTPFGGAAATPTPAFGTTTTPFGQTQKPFGFGTGSAFGAAPSGGFGTNLFGNTSTSSVSLFNKSTASTPSFGGFNQNSQSTSGFGFGNTQTTSTPSLSFGTYNKPATTSAFGGLGSSGGGFGSFGASTKPTFPSLSTPATGFSLSSTPTSLAQPSSTNLFSGIGLGNPSSTTGSAFAPSFSFKPPTTGSFLNPAQPFSSSNLFANTAPTTFTAPTGIVATADMYPYSSMPLLQQGAVQSQERQRTEKPTATPIGVKKPPVTPHYKLEPRQSQKLKLKGYSPGLRRKKEPEQETPRPLEIFSDYSEIISPEAFSRSRRRMINTRPVSLGSIINKDSIAPTPSKPPQQESTTLTFRSPKQETSRQSIFTEPQTPLTALGKNSSFTLSPLRRSPETPKPLIRSFSTPSLCQEEVSTPPAQQERSVTPVQQILAEPDESIIRQEPVTESDDYGDYWTSPSLSELRNMSEAQLKKVIDFTIGRGDLGQIHFTESVDLTGIPLSSLIGDVVEIVPRSVSVYEDCKIPKPPVGQGLNVPAAITLKKCWPVGKVKQDPIRDPADPLVRQRIARLKQMPGTEFISYDAYTGAWTFLVQHFTKYGLDEFDDSDEQSVIYNRLTPPVEDSPMQEIPTSSELLEASLETETVTTFKQFSSLPEFRRQDPLEINEMQEAIFPPEGDEDYDTMEDILDQPPAALPAGFVRIESFSSDEDRDTSAEDMILPSLMTYPSEQPSIFQAQEIEEEQSILPQKHVLQSINDTRRPLKIPRLKYSESITFNRRSDRDMSLFLGHSFRAGWGPNGVIVLFGRDVKDKGKDSRIPEYGVPNVLYIRKVVAFNESEEIEKRRHHLVLQTLSEHTIITPDARGIPKLTISPKITFDHFVKTVGDNRGTYRRHEFLVWKLGRALWDRIPIENEERLGVKLYEKISKALRKKSISKWLQEAVDPDVSSDAEKCIENSDYPGAVVALLSGRRIKKAVETAFTNRDLRTASLLVQLGGNDRRFRKLLEKQIEHWNDIGMSRYIPRTHWKIYEIMAGNVGSSGQMYITEGMDWKRTLGMHFWYGEFLDAEFSQILEHYDSTIESAPGVAAAPIVWYEEEVDEQTHDSQLQSKNNHKDVLYHLMKLYVGDTYLLEDALSPKSITSSPLDYRLTWLLYVMLGCVYKVRSFSDDSLADMITWCFASQLERLEMYYWAIYVSLFIESSRSRELFITHILTRYLHSETNDQFEKLLTDELKIPPEWIFIAKGINAKYKDDVFDEALYFLEAGRHAYVHDLVVDSLAPAAVLMNNIAPLYQLVKKINPDEVPLWDFGGNLYMKYATFLDLATETEPSTSTLISIASLGDDILKILEKLEAKNPWQTRCYAHMHVIVTSRTLACRGQDFDSITFGDDDVLDID